MVNIYEAGPFEGRLLQWPVLATSGALEVRLAETDHEVGQAQRLRYQVFYEEMRAMPSAAMRAARRDFDKFDDVCDHLLVVDRDTHGEDGQPLVVGTYRLTREEDAVRAGGFYTAAEFDLGRMLGLVIPDISNPFWADLARGAQDRAEAEKRSLLIFSSDWDAERERRHLQALRQARVDGIILNPAIAFSGERRPDRTALAELHHEAHARCYIANSLKGDVVVEGFE